MLRVPKLMPFSVKKKPLVGVMVNSKYVLLAVFSAPVKAAAPALNCPLAVAYSAVVDVEEEVRRVVLPLLLPRPMVDTVTLLRLLLLGLAFCEAVPKFHVAAGGVPAHTPQLVITSFTVQVLPSLQLAPTSRLPQPQAPSAILFGSFGQPSMQSRVPSPSVSAPSGTPHPHWPALVLFGSFGQPSLQFGVPSPSLSVSATPHPQMPAAILFGSFGQPSFALQVPSPSVSWKVPAHTQPALHTSLMVHTSLSLQLVPGNAVPFNTPRQSSTPEGFTVPLTLTFWVVAPVLLQATFPLKLPCVAPVRRTSMVLVLTVPLLGAKDTLVP